MDWSHERVLVVPEVEILTSLAGLKFPKKAAVNAQV